MVEFYDVYKFVLANNNMHDEIELLSEHIYQKRKPLEYTTNLVQKHGFSINNVLHDEFYLRYSDGTSMLNHFFIDLAFRDSWIGILPEDKVGPVFMEVEKTLNEYSAVQGGLKLSVPYVCIDAVKTN